MHCIYHGYNTPNRRELNRRYKEYGHTDHGAYKDFNINHYKPYKDLDMELYGIWLEAIDLCAIRSSTIPKEILDDFYYEHKWKYEENPE